MEKKAEFNAAIYVVFILVILRHGINLITQFIKLMTPESVVYGGQVLETSNHTIAAYNMVLSVVIIFSLILVLCKKIIGVYAFLALQIFNCIILSLMVEGDAIINIFVSIIMCAIFAGLLCLRKEGKSGWNILRNN